MVSSWYTVRDSKLRQGWIRDLNRADCWLTYRFSVMRRKTSARRVAISYLVTRSHLTVSRSSSMHLVKSGVLTCQRERRKSLHGNVELDIGPDLTAPYRVPQGDLTATLIQDPRPSPDQSKVAASVLTKIYVMDADGDHLDRLTKSNQNEFKPIWSPDGRWIAYTTWSHARGGHIYKMRSDGKGKPRQLTNIEAFYTDLAFSPDGARSLPCEETSFFAIRRLASLGV